MVVNARMDSLQDVYKQRTSPPTSEMADDKSVVMTVLMGDIIAFASFHKRDVKSPEMIMNIHEISAKFHIPVAIPSKKAMSCLMMEWKRFLCTSLSIF
jgi:hypothetical protein